MLRRVISLTNDKSTYRCIVKKKCHFVKYSYQMKRKLTFGERYLEALREKGISQRELGRRTGATGSAFSLWQDKATADDVSYGLIRAAAKELGVSLDWLANGTGAKHHQPSQDGEVESREVPLISWVDAGKGDEITDPYSLGDGEEMIAVDGDLAGKLSKGAFALRIRGQSMTRPDGDGFHPGDIIIVDPRIKPKPGDYVVAFLQYENKSTFKKYRNRGNNKNGDPIFELVPLNPDYPTITVDESYPGRIIGTMMEYRKRRKAEA